jgi:hypothetical protein
MHRNIKHIFTLRVHILKMAIDVVMTLHCSQINSGKMSCYRRCFYKLIIQYYFLFLLFFF